MNRKATLIATVLGLAAMSACTPQQIAAAVASQAASQSEREGPTVTATVDCSAFDFTVSGYPEGTHVFLEIGSNPPWGFTVGGDLGYGFSPVNGGATGTLAISGGMDTMAFGASIMTAEGNDDSVVAFHQVVDCSTTV